MNTAPTFTGLSMLGDFLSSHGYRLTQFNSVHESDQQHDDPEDISNHVTALHERGASYSASTHVVDIELTDVNRKFSISFIHHHGETPLEDNTPMGGEYFIRTSCCEFKEFVLRHLDEIIRIVTTERAVSQ